jgi:phosphate uptake regulator
LHDAYRGADDAFLQALSRIDALFKTHLITEEQERWALREIERLHDQAYELISHVDNGIIGPDAVSAYQSRFRDIVRAIFEIVRRLEAGIREREGSVARDVFVKSAIAVLLAVTLASGFLYLTKRRR